MQTAHGLENSVVWCQTGPEEATLWRCDVSELVTVMEIRTNVTIHGRVYLSCGVNPLVILNGNKM